MGVWSYGYGPTKITCQRIETTQVSCTLQETRLLGLLPLITEQYNQVTDANVTIESGIPGKINKAHLGITLETSQGGVRFAETPIYFSLLGPVNQLTPTSESIREFIGGTESEHFIVHNPAISAWTVIPRLCVVSFFTLTSLALFYQAKH
mgnify:FL=1